MDGIDTNFRPGLRMDDEWLRASGQVSYGSFQLEDWIPEVYFEMSEEEEFKSRSFKNQWMSQSQKF